MARYYLCVNDKIINIDGLTNLSTKLDSLKDLVFFTGSFLDENELLGYLNKRHYIDKEEFGHIAYVMKRGVKYKKLSEKPIYADRLIYYDAENIKRIFTNNSDNEDFIYYMLSTYAQREKENAMSIIQNANKRLDVIREKREYVQGEEIKEKLERDFKACQNQIKRARSQITRAKTYQDEFKIIYEKKDRKKTAEEIAMEKELQIINKLYTSYEDRPPYARPEKDMGELRKRKVYLEVKLNKTTDYEPTEKDIEEIIQGRVLELVNRLTSENGKISPRKLLYTEEAIRLYQNNHELNLAGLVSKKNIFNDIRDDASIETLIEEESFKKFFNKLINDDIDVIKEFVSEFLTIACNIANEEIHYSKSKQVNPRTLEFINALSGVNVFDNTFPHLNMLLHEYNDYFKMIFRRLNPNTISDYVKGIVLLK